MGQRFREALRRPDVGLRPGQCGAGLIEWGIAVAAIAIFLIFMVTILGNTVNNAFSNVSNGLNAQ